MNMVLLCDDLNVFLLIVSCKLLYIFSGTVISVLLFPGVKRVPIYIPPPMPEDEEHIFETIQKGINFDKYDQISVECTGQNALMERDTIRRLLTLIFGLVFFKSEIFHFTS